MDYANLIVPIDSLAPFEEFVEPYCAETSRKIEELQRKMQVLLKKQGIQARSEIRTVWPGYSNEYKKLLIDTMPENEEEDQQPLMSFESDDFNNVLSTSTDNENSFNQKSSFPRFRTAVSSIEEEVMWKINFSQGVKVKDTKIFFFGSILFRLSFGLHDSSQQHYLHLSVAETLPRDIRVYCKYRIHDPVSAQVLLTQVAETNYTFRADEQSTAGIDNFIGPEVANYLDGFRKLLISVVLSSELGPRGEMLGVQLDNGANVSPYL